MDHKLVNDIRHLLNLVIIKKQLYDYFKNKFNDWMAVVYPVAIQDICEAIPELSDKIEVVPFVADLNPMTGVVKIGWNLFAFGTNRKFLGHTFHESMTELNVGSMDDHSLRNSVCTVTCQELIDFIVDMLNEHSSDYVPFNTIKWRSPPTYVAKMPSATMYKKYNH